MRFVVVQYGGGEVLIHLHSVGNRFRSIVDPNCHRTAAIVADTGLRGWIGFEAVRSLAVAAQRPVRESFYQFVDVDGHMYYLVDGRSGLFEGFIEGFCLDDRTRKTIEQYPGRMVDVLLDHRDYI